MKTLSQLIISFLIIVFGAPIGIFAVNSLFGTHSIMYNNDGTWLCFTKYNETATTCTFSLPFIPASYLKSLGEPGSKLVFNKWVELNICNGNPGSIEVSGRVDPHLVIKCGE